MIDTKAFKPLENRWQDIFKHLENKGYKVYAPYNKIGECKNRFIVLKFAGSSKLYSFSTMQDLYEIFCYVPKNKYSEIDGFKEEVKVAMKELEPMILPYGQIEISYYDDDLKAYYVSMTYKNYKKI